MNSNQAAAPHAPSGYFKIIDKCIYKNGVIATPGSRIAYERRTICQHCGNQHVTSHYGTIDKILYFPGTGFAEAGDIIKIILDNGEILVGDSENGF